ncbi:hypothetical protein EV121DRAFT_297666 [Schizophyllum commune]
MFSNDYRHLFRVRPRICSRVVIVLANHFPSMLLGGNAPRVRVLKIGSCPWAGRKRISTFHFTSMFSNDLAIGSPSNLAPITFHDVSHRPWPASARICIPLAFHGIQHAALSSGPSLRRVRLLARILFVSNILLSPPLRLPCLRLEILQPRDVPLPFHVLERLQKQLQLAQVEPLDSQYHSNALALSLRRISLTRPSPRHRRPAGSLSSSFASRFKNLRSSVFATSNFPSMFSNDFELNLCSLGLSTRRSTPSSFVLRLKRSIMSIPTTLHFPSMFYNDFRGFSSSNLAPDACRILRRLFGPSSALPSVPLPLHVCKQPRQPLLRPWTLSRVNVTSY